MGLAVGIGPGFAVGWAGAGVEELPEVAALTPTAAAAEPAATAPIVPAFTAVAAAAPVAALALTPAAVKPSSTVPVSAPVATAPADETVSIWPVSTA